MLAFTDDLEQVKRFGGWKSDAVHAYLYADHAAGKGRASDMLRVKANFVLYAARWIAAPDNEESGRLPAR